MKRTARLAAVLAPLLAAMVFMLISARPAHSFLPTFASPGNTVHWSLSAFPIQYNINPNTSGAHISGSRSVTAVIQAAFATWTSAPNLNLPVSQGANSAVTAESSSPGNINLICFVCADADFTKDQSTLAVTLFSFATAAGQTDGHGSTSQFPGQLLKADIVFNPADSFTTDPSAATGSVTDLQAVATHEIGHFFGLDHSGVIDAIMFPFLGPNRDTLASDDVAGISALYPGSQSVGTGTVQGQVVFATGGGVFGAHVFADSTSSNTGYGGNIRKSPISALTDPSGNYTISGLPADTYTITAEPLDGPATNNDVSDYPKIFGKASVQTNFTTRQH